MERMRPVLGRVTVLEAEVLLQMQAADRDVDVEV